MCRPAQSGKSSPAGLHPTMCVQAPPVCRRPRDRCVSSQICRQASGGHHSAALYWVASYIAKLGCSSLQLESQRLSSAIEELRLCFPGPLTFTHTAVFITDPLQCVCVCAVTPGAWAQGSLIAQTLCSTTYQPPALVQSPVVLALYPYSLLLRLLVVHSLQLRAVRGP